MINESTIPSITQSHIPSLGSFLSGTPERILAATKTPKVLIAWLHGDEPLGAHVARHIYSERPDLTAHVDYLCGNPRAAGSVPAKGFCESDLNRSFDFTRPAQTYEQKRAVEIAELAKRYDYVLDIHNAVDPAQGKSLIVPHAHLHKAAIRDLIAASPIKRIIVMEPAPVARSLIGTAPNAITVEYSFEDSKKHGVADVVRLLENLAIGRAHTPTEREFYYVEGTIPKTQDPGPSARNFEFYEPGGYYPIILGTGPRSYREDPTKDYCCFYATRREIVKL